MHLSMKYVIALVKPLRLDEILNALTSIGVQELTVTEAKAYGRQKGPTEFYRGAEYTPKFVTNLKLEFAVSSDRVEQVTEAIVGVARPGKSVGSEIFVLDLDQALSTAAAEPPAIVPRRAA
jgi:nitrogen regulatory protein PII